MIEQAINWFIHLDIIGKCLVIYFAILFILILWKVVFHPEHGNQPVFPDKYRLNVNKKYFIEEVVRWGLQNIRYENIHQTKVSKKSIGVQVEVLYYENKRRLGEFNSVENKIRVFVNNHSRIEHMVQTTLHEVVHNLQYKADPRNFSNKYATLLEKYKYHKHPMEIEANEISNDEMGRCIRDLLAKGILIKN